MKALKPLQFLPVVSRDGKKWNYSLLANAIYFSFKPLNYSFMTLFTFKIRLSLLHMSTLKINTVIPKMKRKLFLWMLAAVPLELAFFICTMVYKAYTEQAEEGSKSSWKQLVLMALCTAIPLRVNRFSQLTKLSRHDNIAFLQVHT
jgi:hypothetical protein